MIRLPPSAALRALESAARHLSYTRAAAELHVTQSAVSHQIRHIEQLWALKLFERRGRRLVLTTAGQTLAPLVRDFLERLSTALDELGDPAEEDATSLRVSLVQSFALKWLVPRLPGFKTRHPDIDLWISTTDDVVDLRAASVDVAIRLGQGGWADVHHELMLREYVFPVCSPELKGRLTRLEAPQDLLDAPLLYRQGDDVGAYWRDWFRDAKVVGRRLRPGPVFPDTGMAVQAAIDGLGIALARSTHVEEELAGGRLVKLFDVYSPSPVAYYFTCLPESRRRPKVQAFRDWITGEAAEAQLAFDRSAGADAIPAYSEGAGWLSARSRGSGSGVAGPTT